ncbi:MAG: hypothetical protein QGI83_02815 [Candidatus Latescibacteria bacterium]|jgi:hypothetical protein|nr:hypothetical protein [Candidatus Latescibacterota bacterium]
MPSRTQTGLILLLAVLLAGVDPAPASAAGAKSPRKAALLSLLVPGTGELYAGGGKSARFFLFTEGTFWTGLLAFRALASARRSTFESYAAAHSGVNPAGRPNSFLDELERFDSIYARNAWELNVSGDQASPRPETPEDIWEWDSEASRLEFRELRSRKAWASQKAFLCVGALLLNRFASALNAARIARKTDSAAQPRNLEVGLATHPEGATRGWLRVRF